jgi:hypothetical protein
MSGERRHCSRPVTHVPTAGDALRERALARFLSTRMGKPWHSSSCRKPMDGPSADRARIGRRLHHGRRRPRRLRAVSAACTVYPIREYPIKGNQCGWQRWPAEQSRRLRVRPARSRRGRACPLCSPDPEPLYSRRAVGGVGTRAWGTSATSFACTWDGRRLDRTRSRFSPVRPRAAAPSSGPEPRAGMR